METVSEEVKESKNEEANEEVVNEVNEEAPEEAPKQEDASPEARELHDLSKIEEEQEEAKPKAKPKKMARSVKVIELVNCPDCDKKMLPKTLRHSHPKNCKGQPTETRPVAKQQNSYGSKLKEQLRKEIEEEMKTKYKTKNEVVNHNEVVNYSEPIEVKTKASVPSGREAREATASRPVRMEREPSRCIREREAPKQLTATELLQQHYSEIRKAKQLEKIEKIPGSKAVCFNINIIFYLNNINNNDV